MGSERPKPQFLMLETGLEPALSCENQPLKLARLPVSPLQRQKEIMHAPI